jgi:hypothetical protein
MDENMETSHTITSLNARPEFVNSQAHKTILEEIKNNMKELEGFLNINQKIRSTLYEMVQVYLMGSDDSKIEKIL